MSTVKRTEIREERRVVSSDGFSDPFFQSDIDLDNFSRKTNAPSSENNNTSTRTTTRTTTTTSSGTTSELNGNETSNSDKEPGKFTEVIALGGNIGPEDLSVTLKDNIMTIEAKVDKERKSEDGTTTSKVYQQITRKFNLPSNVDPAQVKTVLTPEGNLKIEAPYQQKALPPPPAPTPKREADVPIKIR